MIKLPDIFETVEKKSAFSFLIFSFKTNIFQITFKIDS